MALIGKFDDYHTIHGLKLKNYVTFVNAIESGFGWIDINDIQRQWEGFFNDRISENQLNFLIKSLQENNLTRNDYEYLDDNDNDYFEEDEP